MASKSPACWEDCNPFSHNPQKEPTLLIGWFWTSSLQNSDTMNSCWLNHPFCSTLLPHLLGSPSKLTLICETNKSRNAAPLAFPVVIPAQAQINRSLCACPKPLLLEQLLPSRLPSSRQNDVESRWPIIPKEHSSFKSEQLQPCN